ncbi:MAG: hypothetical protein NVS2B5_28080 [Beijerinckiaceae bacterium]
MQNPAMIRLTRRSTLLAALSFAASCDIGALSTRAEGDSLFDLRGDDGKPVVNYRLPSELSVSGLPGVIWAGAANPDAILVEFFDYNCPYCRRASPDLDALLAGDGNFRLGLVNNSILGLGSVQAAKVQQAVLKLYGPKRAYGFHKAMFARRGINDGPAALQTAGALGLDRTAIEKAADGDDVGAVLRRQVNLAESLGFAATPSFMLNGVGILGYPGPQSIARMIAAVRKCDKLVC